MFIKVVKHDGSEPLKQLRAAIELSRLPRVGAAKFKELIDIYGNPFEALQYWLTLRGTNNQTSKASLSAQQLAEVLTLPPAIEFTYYGATDYPPLLGRLSEPPPYLFRTGTLWPLPQMAIAIVGTRNCSAEGAVCAHDLAAQLATRGVVIISGGARGIDTAAHRGALDAGGLSVLVTATGIQQVYPPENHALFYQIRQRGCLLTELLPGTPPRRDFFPTRNRIIVGLASAVVIVEGRLRSGTWSSAHHALQQQRLIFVWTKSPCVALRELPNFLLGRGAFSLDTIDNLIRQLPVKKLP